MGTELRSASKAAHGLRHCISAAPMQESKRKNQIQCHRPAVLVPQKAEEEDHAFKASLDNIVRPRLKK